LTLTGLRALSVLGWLDLKRERAASTGLIDLLDVAPRDPAREVRFLSGGNQRKVLLGRAMFGSARLLVLEEPTQGVDIEARRQIHEQLREMARSGVSIVFVSTDLEELITLADRIVVFRGGRVGEEFSPIDLAPDELLAAIQTEISARRIRQ
jgi:ABC-type sugar transport system ATPase subunit